MDLKKILLAALVVALGATGAQARNTWDDFGSHVTQANVRAFTKDLGGLIGAGTYTTGRVLGWGAFKSARAPEWCSK